MGPRRFDTLEQWLAWQETLHPSEIELGLERVGKVWRRLRPQGLACPVITVAGTNGKGSTVAMLEAILVAAGYRVGAYTSPHLRRYTERIHLAGAEVDADALCEAFARVDQARDAIPLTYFEFGTLAALDLFAGAGLDVVVLEVGLGGRLDAVNIVDPDVAVVTSVALDHAEWLGETRDDVGREKAGIFREGRPGVCADPDPPEGLVARARALRVPLYTLGDDFSYQPGAGGWEWAGPGGERLTLPHPGLRADVQLRNAAAAVMALELLHAALPVSPQHLRQGLLAANAPARLQLVPGDVPVILDVAHNVEAAQALASGLAQMPGGRVHAVVGMLSDKDHGGVVAALAPLVGRWYPVGLEGRRGLGAAELAQRIRGAAPTAEIAAEFEDPGAGLTAASAAAAPGERILVFGSFLTVGRALEILAAERRL